MYFTTINNMYSHLINGDSKNAPPYELFAHYYVKWLSDESVSINKICDDYNYIRIEKIVDGICETNVKGYNKPIASMDLKYFKSTNTVEIHYWMVNHNDPILEKIFGEPLEDHEANQIFKLLFDYAEKFAKEHNCTKIRRDVHQNLIEYNIIKNIGFTLTNQRAEDNGFWVITYKHI